MGATTIQALFTALAAGLSIWEHKEARSYANKLMNLRRNWHNEYNKKDRDDAVLDNIEFELCLLCNGYSAEIEKQVAAPK